MPLFSSVCLYSVSRTPLSTPRLFIYAQRRSVRSREAKMCADCRRMQTNSLACSATSTYLSICVRATLAICRINNRRHAAEGAGPEDRLATPTSGGSGDTWAEFIGARHHHGEREDLSQRNRATLIIPMTRGQALLQKPRRQKSTPFSGASFRRRFFVPYTSRMKISGTENTHGLK